MKKDSYTYKGFSLAELLISLAILGVIATFTIPKLLSISQTSSNNAKIKEIAAAISGAYQLYQMKNVATSGTGISDITQYLNYVAVDTATVIDDKQTLSSRTCSATDVDSRCLKMHSGAILRYAMSGSGYNFGGTNTTNAIWFDIDPDGAYSGTTNGAGKSVEFWLYYSGRLTSYGTIDSSTCTNGGCVTPNPAYDPPWFSW